MDLILQSRLEKKEPTVLLNLQVEITEQLAPSSFEVEMAQSNYDRCPGTGTWLLEDTTFHSFVQNSTSATMFLCGGPGFGKSFLLSLVVDHLRKMFELSKETSVTYFFCDSKTEDSSKRTTLSIVKTLIAQLLERISQKDPGFVKGRVAALSNVRQEARMVSSLFYTSFESCLKQFQSNYIVIDALDECDDWHEILKTFTRFPDEVRSTIKLILSSQSTAGIPYSVQQLPLQSFSKIDIDQESMENDIARYVNWRTQSLDIRSLGTREDALELLVEGSQGLFILARLKLDILEREILPHSVDVKKAVEELPKGIYSYYERSLSRLSPENLCIARRMFEWIIYSQAPLNVRELGVACVNNMELSSHEQSNALTVRGIESFGVGLIEIFDDRVRLIHSTVRQFLLSFGWEKACNSDFKFREDSIHARLATKCIEYLSIPLLVSDINSTASLPPLLVEKFPFSTYAARHWIDHLRLSSSTDESLINRVLQFLDCEGGLAWWLQYTSLVEDDNWWSLPRLTSTWLDWLNRQSVSFGVLRPQVELIARLCQQHLRLFEDASADVDIPNYIRALLRLAAIKDHSMERLQAEKLYRKALEESQKLCGPSHGFWRCRILLDLACLIRGDGKLSEARSLSGQLLASPEINNKVNLRVFLGAQQLEGEILRDMRHLFISERVLEAGFSHAQQLLDENDPDVLAMRNALALTLIELDKLQEARNLLDIKHFELALGKDHPSTLTGMGNVAFLLEREGKLQQASDISRLVWSRRQEIDSPGSFQTISTGVDFSKHLHSRGKHSEALELQKTLLKQVSDTVGADHPMALNVEAQMVNTLCSQRRLDLALKHQQHFVAEEIRRLGEHHWFSICAKCGTAKIYELQGRYDEAEKMRLEALDYVRNDPDMTYIDRCSKMTDLAYIWHLQDRVEEAEALQLDVIKELQRHGAHNRPRMLNANNYLGRLKLALCKYREAEQLHQNILEERQKTHDKDHPNMLHTMGNLAAAKRSLGKLNEAMKLHEQILAGYRKYEDEDSPNILQTLRNMSTTKRYQGKLREAEQLLVSVLAALQRKGENKASILATKEDLALTKESRGELQYARTIYEQILEEHSSQNRDPKNAQVLQVKAGLASVLQAIGKLAEAEQMVKEVITERKKILKPDAVWVLVAKGRLALIMHDQGKLQEAAELQTWILKKRQEREGAESSNTLTEMSNLALTKISQGQLEEAERLQTTVVKAYQGREDDGGERPALADAWADLAWTKGKMRKLIEARDLQQAALDMFRKTWDADSSVVLKALARLGSIKAQLGEAVEAEDLQTQVVEKYQSMGDSLERGRLASALCDLAWTKGILDKLAEAKDLAKTAFNLYLSTDGENSRAALIAKGRMACYMSRLGECEEAKELQIETIATLKEIGAGRSDEALWFQTDLACTCRDLGEYTEAERLQGEVLALRKASSDEGNFDVLRAMTELAHIKHSLGKDEEGEALLEEVLMYCRRIEGGTSYTLIVALSNLALVKKDLNKMVEAEQLQDEIAALELEGS